MSQLQFFMTEADERAFLAGLRERSDTDLLLGRFFFSDGPTPLSSLPSLVGDYPDISQSLVTLVHRGIEHGKPPTPVDSGPYRGQYMFETYRRATIEWSRSYICERGALVSGRLHAKPGHLESASANRAYDAWWRSISSRVRRNCTAVGGGWWVAPQAQLWSEAGGVLAYGDPLAMKRSLKSGAV